MRNKWIQKVLSLSALLAMTIVFSTASPALAAATTTVSLNGTLGSNGYWVSDVTVTLEATGNGVTLIEYSFDYWYTAQNYTAPFTISGEGWYTLDARAWDSNGMGETVVAYFNIDLTPPTTSFSLIGGQLGNNGWYLSTPDVWMQGDDNVSSVNIPVEYSLNGGSSWQSFTGMAFPIGNEGITTILAKSINNAGILESPPASIDVKIDQTAPVVTETVTPSQISSKKSGTMFNISYNGTAVDTFSGIYLVNTELIDEYGVYSQNLGANLSGTVSVERHYDSNDPDGRTYTFRLTATDLVGHQTTIDAVTTVTRH